MKITSLDKLKKGQRCRVINLELDEEVKYRLLDMGIVPNTIIELVKIAPLGDPIQIQLRGYNLSIRKELAQKIRVEVSK